MRRHSLAVLAAFLVTIVTCTGTNSSDSSGNGGPGSKTSDASQDKTKNLQGQPGWVLLTNGHQVHGRILSIEGGNITLEQNGKPRVFLKGYFAGYGFEDETSSVNVSNSKENDASKSSLPPSSWYPRFSQQERMDQTQVTFFDPHPWTGGGSCTGALAKTLEENPEFVLFGEPGGKVVLHDPKKWGYHSHAFPGDTLQRPVKEPGLKIELAKELPQSLAFVSPASLQQSPDHPNRTSYAIPDAVYAKVRNLSAAEATLSSQLFAGGAPRETSSGALWAFSLPRNDRQFWVYLFDGERKHGKILSQAFAAYGDAILLPDLMIDMLASDGTLVGRVMLLPLPESLSADGPAPQPVSILTGKDAAVLTTVPVPARQAIVLPPKAPSTKADVYINFYEVSQTVTEKIIVAYGIGAPDKKDVTVKTRALTQAESDEHVKIDASSLPADQFPSVAWLFFRRSFAWRDGGFRPEIQPISAPMLRGKAPTKTISNYARIPHTLPILFVGPDPGKSDENSLLDSPVVGGMANSLLSDALQREAGLVLQGLSTLADIGNAADRPKDKGDSVTSVTNVYITIPPHTGVTDGGVTSTMPGGRSLYYTDKNYGQGTVNPFLSPDKSWGQGKFGGYNVMDPSGTTYSRHKEVIYDPATGSSTYSGSSSGTQGSSLDISGAGIDPLTGNLNSVNVTMKKRGK